MRQIVVPFVAALLGGGVGAFAATHWLPGTRAGAVAPSGETGAALDAMREQWNEWRIQYDRPRELAAPVTSGPITRSGAGSATSLADATTTPAASAALEAAIEKAVAAGIESARKKDPATFGPPPPDPKKHATVAEIARDLSLSSAQEDDIRRAYTESTEKFLKLLAEPDSTPDALRRELDEAKGDAGKRAGLMMKYMPKMLGKLGEVIAIQSDRDQRIHKALGAENVPKYAKYKVAEEDPFGLDGSDINISAGVNDK